MNSRPKVIFNPEKAKLCYFCGNKFSANHKQSCPARNVTCRNCSKKGHFAKFGNSKTVTNGEAESDETTEENCNFIISDSESKIAVLTVEDVRPIVESVKKLEVISAATGKLRCLQILLRCNKTIFKVTVDTGSPASFVNKRTADYIVKSVPSAVVLSEKECPIDTVYVDYNRKRIELMGTLVVNVSSLGWSVKSAKTLISENRRRCMLGLDLHSQLGFGLRKLDHLGHWWAKFPSRTLMRRQNFGDRIFTRSIDRFFLALVEQKVIKFSLFSSRGLFPFKKRGGGSLFIFRTKLGMKFGN